MQNILFSKKTGFLKKSILAFIGSLILAISSQLSIPLEPVPITFQTAVVLFIGMVYGWRLGGSAIILYLLEGVIGLPVFANFSCGLPVLFGPTGGYLLGFLPAAIVVGWIIEKGWRKNILSATLAGIIGIIIIYICGFTALSKFIGIQNAFLFGVKPFFLIDVAKLLLVIWLVPKFWREN